MRRHLILVLVLAVCMTMFSGGIMVHAKEKEDAHQTRYKYYTCIQIEAGDTLWNIAGRFLEGCDCSREEYIREIRQLNDLKGDSIRTGQYLTVVYYSAEYK